MPLFTCLQFEQLLHNGAMNRINNGPVPVLKLHLPGADCIWLLTEFDPNDPMMAYGLADLGNEEPKMGPIDFSASSSLKPPLNIALEQDEEFIGRHPISVYASATLECGFITEDPDILRRHQVQRRRPGLYPI